MALKQKSGVSMHKAREILRLIFEKRLKDREIADSCSVSHMTVNNYRTAVNERKLPYAQLSHMSDSELENILKCRKGRKRQTDRPQPDFSRIQHELRKKGVTLQLLSLNFKASSSMLR